MKAGHFLITLSCDQHAGAIEVSIEKLKESRRKLFNKDSTRYEQNMLEFEAMSDSELAEELVCDMLDYVEDYCENITHE